MPADVLIQRAAIFSSALLFAFSLSVLPAAAQDGQVSGAMLLAPKDLDLAAAGAFDDTLEACVARIPEDATTGQRLVAEQTCEREEMVRAVIQEEPRF